MISLKNKKLIAGICTAFTLAAGNVLFTAEAQAAEAPTIDAKAAVIIEDETDKVLLSQNADVPFKIASMTKMLSIYIVLEKIEDGTLTWDQKVSISDYVNRISQDYELSNVPLRTDEQYTVQELYESALLYSANGSIIALAEQIAGTEAQFVDLMTAKLDEWGIEGSTIYNATGLPNDYAEDQLYPGAPIDDENQMTAIGVATVADHLIDDFPEVLETASLTEKVFREGTIDETKMTTYNHMLSGQIYYREGVDGLKTGTTDESGASFTGTAVENDMRIITVLIGADEKEKRFTETNRMMDYAFSTFEKVKIISAGDAVSTENALTVKNGKTDSVGLVYKTDLVAVKEIGAEETELETTFNPASGVLNAEGEVEAPITKGTDLGTVDVSVAGDDLGYLNGEKSKNVEVTAASTVEKANIFVIAWRAVAGFFSNVWSSITSFAGGLF